MQKKKILILIDWFYPAYKAGGPIQSGLNICLALRHTYDIEVITTDTDHGETQPLNDIKADTWRADVIPGVKIYYASKAGLSAKKLQSLILASDADFVYLNHMFSPMFVLYPIWMKLRRRLHAKLVVCPRGALYDSALAVKPYKKFPVLKLLKAFRLSGKVLFHATNGREKDAILKYFPGSEVVIADNLPNLELKPFEPIEKKKGEFRCIFVARIVAIKNLLFLLKALKSQQAAIELTVVGPMEDAAYWAECEKEIAALPQNIKVNYIGAQPNSSLPALIRSHHLFALPTTGENFGHAIFESFSAGRPVLISDQTPWLNLQRQNAGFDLPLGRPDLFEQKIAELADMEQSGYEKLTMGAWQFAKQFVENPDLIAQYKELFS